MKTLDEIKQFYESQLLGELRRLETQRKQAMRNSFIVFAAAIVIALVIGGIFTAASGNPIALLIAIVIAIVIAIAIGASVSASLSRGYKTEFKEKVIGQLIRFMEPGLSYQPQQCITQDVFRQSDLFQQRIDRYHGEDCVSGKVGQTEIVFSEVHAEYKTTSGSGKHRQTHWHTIFKGLFFIADFNKHFNGPMVVLPDTAQKLFGSFGQTLQSWSGRGELVRLEDPEFEKQFVVYGSDQVEARYILSTSLMQKITQFKQKTGGQIYLSFTGSKVFVAVSMAKNMFEPAYLSCAADFGCIQEYYQDLALAIGIVDDLNLNTRIWTKS
ncbi:MAG: DUF3137 domain-containing protein [Planctomycetaceae bacterium]|nr:DUF3137 domain-containing protein [Planctomycetaceae bacterium]